MPSIQSLVDDLGIPPREVCLDWALQLHQLDDPASQEQPSAAWHFSEIKVADNGQLTLPVETKLAKAIGPAVLQLVNWANSDAQEDSTCEVSQALEVLRTQLAKFDSQHLSSTDGGQVQPLMDAQPTVDVEPTVQEKRSRGEQLSLGSQNIVKGGKIASRGRARGRKQASSSFPRKRFALAAIVVILTGLVLSVFLTDRSTSIADTLASGTLPRDTVDLPENAGDAFDQPSESTELLELAELSSSNAEFHGESGDWNNDALGNLAANLSFDLVSQLAPGPLTSASDTAVSSASDTAAALDGASSAWQLSQNREDQLALEDVEGVDLVSALKDVAMASGAVELEDSLPTQLELPDSSPQPLLIGESMRVALFPTVQIRKLAAGKIARMRKPAWELQIVQRDGFEMTPAIPRTVAGNEPVAWQIKSTVKKLSVALVVAVQVIDSRNAALRWQIAAVSESVPQCLLPLDQDALSQTQDFLRNYNSQLAFAIEQIERMRSTTGIPSSLKSNLYQRRKAMEANQETCAQLLKAVADANQVARWLDHELEFRAALFAHIDDSLPTLQYGTFEEDQAASETAAAIVEDKLGN
ncbi:MAG: hypothetical protein KDB22_16895 [Planctomycetales bacterium]|nr:hypothetical protein [Planctomycetales bacterium]